MLYHLDVDLQTVEIEKLPIEQFKNLEADSYWCMSKLLDRIQENYVFCQPGIQNNVKALENLIKRIDSNLLFFFFSTLFLDLTTKK